MSRTPRTLPDLRRLTVDVSTVAGTYSSGLVVQVLGGRRETGKLRVCLDGPGYHLGPCRQAWLPRHAVTTSALVRVLVDAPRDSHGRFAA